MFRLEVSHLQALTIFCYQMFCPLWDPYGIPKWAKHLVAKNCKDLKMTNLESKHVALL